MQEKGEKSFRVAFDAVLTADPDLKAASAGISQQQDMKVEAGKAKMERMFPNR